VGLSKNILNTTLKKMGRLDKKIVFNVLITVATMICDSVVVLLQELRRPIFLEGVFGLTPTFGEDQNLNS
jgi:hypothetical protein